MNFWSKVSFTLFLIFLFTGTSLPLIAQIESPNDEFGLPVFSFRTTGSPSVPFSCTGASFDFGEVIIGETETLELLIRNEGSGYLFIYSMEMLGDDAFSVTPSFSSDDVPILLDEGEELFFTITYTPEVVGDLEAKLVVHHSAALDASCIINFDGSAREFVPGTLGVFYQGEENTFLLDCETTTLEFEDVLVGGSSFQTVIVKNIGDAPLQFHNYSISGVDANQFSAIAPPIAVPYTMAPGEELVFIISFFPTSPGEKKGVITFYTEKTKCSFLLEGGGMTEKPFLSIFSSEGDPVLCGGSIAIDLPGTGPGWYGFYYTFRNYGMYPLEVSGTVSVQGSPSSAEIEAFTVNSLEFIFLETLVYLPGNTVTTLIYELETNDPSQPTCTVYVTINQLYDTFARGSTDGSAIIKETKWMSTEPVMDNIRYTTRSSDKVTDGIKLYPTVSSDFITIESPGTSPIADYQIVNMQGKLMKTGRLVGGERARISISDLSTGLYLIKIEGVDQPLRFVKASH